MSVESSCETWFVVMMHHRIKPRQYFNVKLKLELTL